MATLNWTIYARNTGVEHELIVGASVFADPISDETFIGDLAWWVIINPGISSWGVPLSTGVSLPAGKYWIRARAWENRSGGTKIIDLTSEGEIVGYVYVEGILTGILDTKDISFTAAGVAAEIINVSASLIQ